MGIKAFSAHKDDVTEIESPMRLKKKGLDKLKISQMEPDTDKKYEKLEVVFESVINNFK